MQEPTNKKALETGSGIKWSEWVKFLEEHAALDHPAMAKVALEYIKAHGASKSPEWWAQNVTIAYERYIGRRKVGQQCDGNFSVTVSKTVPGTMSEILENIVKKMEGITKLDGVKITSAPSVSETEKWRYWRTGLEDGSRIAMNIQTKPKGKTSSVAINHDKLGHSKDVERWRSFWKSFELER